MSKYMLTAFSTRGNGLGRGIGLPRKCQSSRVLRGGRACIKLVMHHGRFLKQGETEF